MYCIKCGKELRPEYVFCTKCGEPVQKNINAISQKRSPVQVQQVQIDTRGLNEVQLIEVKRIFSSLKKYGVDINNQLLCCHVVGVISNTPSDYVSDVYSGINSLVECGIIRDVNTFAVFAPYIRIASINRSYVPRGENDPLLCSVDIVTDVIKKNYAYPNFYKILILPRVPP
jgi:hypothetical protein